MDQPFVTNEIIVSKHIGEVEAFLRAIDSLCLWNSEIIMKKSNGRSFTITRSKKAANDKEEVIIESVKNRIIYHFVGEKLSYDVHFILNEQEENTHIIENMVIVNKDNFFLPVQLFRSIVKTALAEKLTNLAQILNQWEGEVLVK